MASTVPFKLITPTQVVFEGPAELVIAVGTEGEEGILPHHAPFLTALKPGVLRANTEGSAGPKRLELATSDGFMQALPDRVTVLVNQAFRFEDIDIGAARTELTEAMARLASATDPATQQREQTNVDFANAKLRLTGH